jgi:hypothetical protein
MDGSWATETPQWVTASDPFLEGTLSSQAEMPKEGPPHQPLTLWEPSVPASSKWVEEQNLLAFLDC